MTTNTGKKTKVPCERVKFLVVANYLPTLGPWVQFSSEEKKQNLELVKYFEERIQNEYNKNQLI